MQETNPLMLKVREAEAALNAKRLEAAGLPTRIEELETRKRGLSDANTIRQVMAEIRELEREKEVFELVLRSHAVAVEEGYAAFYADRLKDDRVSLDKARLSHQTALETLKQAEQALEDATAQLRKAEHDQAEAERNLKTRQDAASNLRSGQLTVAA